MSQHSNTSVVIIQPKNLNTYSQADDLLTEVNIALEDRKTVFLIDFSSISHLPDFALGCLLQAYYQIQANKGLLCLCFLDERLKGSIQRINLGESFLIFNDRADFDRYIAQSFQ